MYVHGHDAKSYRAGAQSFAAQMRWDRMQLNVLQLAALTLLRT